MPYKDSEAARAYRRNRYLARRAEFIAQVSDCRRRRRERARLTAIFSAARLHPAERLLTARNFNVDALRSLATREHYADAMLTFVRAAHLLHNPVGSLLSDARLIVYRVACACGAILCTQRQKSAFQLEDLRTLARSKDREERERVLKALAVLGFINWHNSRHEVRAAYCVGRLFEERPL